MRYWEIDFLRGLGIILMLISNFVTDLQIFLNHPQNLFWRFFALFTASIFVFTSGISFQVSSKQKILKRFLKLIFLGFVITAVTAILLKDGAIYFGILHFLALAWIIALPFSNLGYLNIPLAFLFILLHFFVDGVHANTLLLLPLGITPSNFYTFDYFPIFPWFGVFLLGLPVGELFLQKNPSENKNIFISIITYLGRNSLKIYLIHQPIFVGLILLFFEPDFSIFRDLA